MKKAFTVIFLLFSIMPLGAIESRELEEIIKNLAGSKNIQQGNIVSDKIEEINSPAQGIVKDRSAGQEEEKNKSLSFPSADEGLLKSGIQLFEAGLFDNSKQKLDELKSKYPDSQFKDLASIWLSKINIESKNYEEATKILSSISQESGEYPSAIYNIAGIHLRKGNDSGAIEYFYRIASMFPDHDLADDSYISIARIYLKNGKGSQALESAIRIVKYYAKRETVDDAYFILAQVFERDRMLKDFGVARTIYKIFLKKANVEKAPFFAGSPLLDKVKSNLSNIENSYYNKAFIKSS